MTENELKILLRLNKSRSQNNVDGVLSEELEIPKYDVGQAVNSLLQKGYVYEDSNANQKNLGLRAWKITHDGELKVNELKTKESAENRTTQTRQLAAIMFTDIVGYTALMSNDEKKAFEILGKNRQIQKPIIEQYNGRWIKELGDGVMASFNTASDAVNAAMKIQEACNAAKKFQLKIGIHLGEVVFENDDIYGDGVNIASRIETLGIGSSVLMSKSIRDQIKNNVEFQIISLGSFEFKNVGEAVEVFAIANPGFVVPKKDAMQGKLKISSLVYLNTLQELWSAWEGKKLTDLQKKEIRGKKVVWDVYVIKVDKPANKEICLTIAHDYKEWHIAYALAFFVSKDKKALESLNIGDKISMKGTIQEWFLSPILKNCKLLSRL